jgi:hypothetical protein
VIHEEDDAVEVEEPSSNSHVERMEFYASRLTPEGEES